MRRAANDAAEPRAAIPLRPVSKTRPGDDRLLVTLTVGEQRDLVRDAAWETVAEASDDPPPALLDRAGIAWALGVGTATVDRMRREGCPIIRIGDSPRFELADCLTWLRTRGAK